MENYSNSKIYRIVPSGEFDEGDIYIGSTTTHDLQERLAYHINNYSKICKKYIFASEELFNKYGAYNCKIELIELFPCNSKEVLIKRECEIIRQSFCINRKYFI